MAEQSREIIAKHPGSKKWKKGLDFGNKQSLIEFADGVWNYSECEIKIPIKINDKSNGNSD